MDLSTEAATAAAHSLRKVAMASVAEANRLEAGRRYHVIIEVPEEHMANPGELAAVLMPRLKKIVAAQNTRIQQDAVTNANQAKMIANHVGTIADQSRTITLLNQQLEAAKAASLAREADDSAVEELRAMLDASERADAKPDPHLKVTAPGGDVPLVPTPPLPATSPTTLSVTPRAAG